MELPIIDGLVFDVRVDFGHPLPQAVIPAEPVAAFPMVGNELGVLDLAVLVDGEQGVARDFITVGFKG
jgi:hypothetical protein